jgi:sigma-B regulation protein RsbU (phosphoserine phosphatase)
MIDLTALDIYVRPGFAFEWSYYEPSPGDPAWKRIPANAGNRPLILRDLDLPGMQTRSRLAIGRFKPDKFTAILGFDASSDLLESSSGVGLYLQDIGRNWEVYLNGSVVTSEVHLSRTGSMVREKAVHGALVDIDKRFLKLGRNVLTFVMLGDAQEARTGFFSSGPYLIGDYQSLQKLKGESLDLMLIGIYFFFALYHLILFALRPANRPYLFYGLGTLAFAIYLFSRTYIVYDLVADTSFIRGIELSSLFIFFPLFLGFFDLCNRGRISLFSWIYGGTSLAFAFLAPVLWGEVLLEVWQRSLPLPILYLLVFDVLIPVVQAIRGRGREDFKKRLRALFRIGEFWTVAIAFVIVVLAVLAAVVDLNSDAAFAAAKLAAFFLIFGTATVLARQFTGLFRDVEDFNAGLEAKVRERTAALEAAMEEQSGLNSHLQAANLRVQDAMDLAARDMKIAVQVQQGIFPRASPDTADWELAFVYLPASDVSGDFYDFYVEGDKLAGVVVGDVTGHGISSGLITVLARSIFYRGFRDLAASSLGRVVEELNAELSSELSAVDNYLTASMLRFRGNQVEYVNAAGTDLAFRREGRPRANLVAPEMPGGFRGTPLGREGLAAPYKSIKFGVATGDSLFLYTDCLRDAVDDAGAAFGTEGILSAYGRAPADSAEAMLEYILDEWKFHVGKTPVTDDLTAMLLRKKGG